MIIPRQIVQTQCPEVYQSLGHGFERARGKRCTLVIYLFHRTIRKLVFSFFQ